ncbi:site-specific integrase [Lysinibacillus fusiformis]|uniref:site-specific integrase n=1 Tax=Lysinibacillus fusiformis TaxID=28031 RepID=UPI0018816DB7|nr:site-specific integrase [Lysinibacillus fusiformis]MBD8521846.1 site-specific integrase [Lysinibacillus fusiformis]
MASVQKYKLKDGKERWMYVIENGTNPISGKRERIVKRGFLKEKEAIKAARDMEYEMEKWNLDLKNKITFRELTEEWFKHYRSMGVKKATIRIREYESNKLLTYFSDKKVKDITQVLYQRFLNEMNNELNINTLSGINGTAKMIFKYARELGIIHNDPTEFAKLPKKIKTVEEIENENVQDVYFEKHELKEFLDSALEYGKKDDYFIFNMLAWTGMRLGELLALKWSDIDLENRTISITKTLYNPNNNILSQELTPPKTNGSVRTIDIEPELIELLKSHRLLQKQVKLALGAEYNDFDFVATKLKPPNSGHPYHSKLVNVRMQVILKHTKIKKHLTPHSFRHTHTSLLAEVDVPLELIMERLGHESDKTTTKVYLHVTKDRKKEASEKFGNLMRRL